ncbi:DNA primase, partial [Patescibacteria group bacterium]
DEKIYKERQEILKLNALVAEYYNYILVKHKQGKKGREYIKGRKITRSLVEKFKIGYAPHAYTNLIKFLQSKGYKLKDLIKWGLVVATNGRTYDKFRSRIIFPLIDHHGDVVGFSGRTTLKNTKAPKYLHSPQTLAFNKSKFLFGLNLAKSEGRKKDFLIFCEGQLDAVSSYKTKVNNVVASLGTALAADQLELAKRYTKNIYFCFDNDLAGETALIHSANLSHNVGLNVKAVNIPQGKDADELINTRKADWESAVKKAEPIVDHMLRRLYKRLDLSKLEGKEEFSKIILPIIASIPQRIEQSHYLHRLALILNIDENILTEELDKLKKTIDEGRNITQVNTQNIKKILESPVNIKEEYLLALIFQHSQFLDVSLKQCKAKYFSSPLARQICTKLGKYAKGKKRFSIKNFVSGLEEHEISFVQNLLLKILDDYFELESEYEKEIAGIIKFLRKNYLHNRVKRIKAKIEQAEISESKAEVKKLIGKLIEVTDKLGKV